MKIPFFFFIYFSSISSQYKHFNTKESIAHLKSYANLTLVLENGCICLECGDDFQEENHIRHLAKCIKCKYQTVCTNALMEHVSVCAGETASESVIPYSLGKTMFCICGFQSDEGNDLARHLATCDRKSAYESTESAQANTVKCNMLDMLGLVRRDGEEEEDSSEGLLIPADQQQQLLSKSIDRDENEQDNEKINDDDLIKSQTNIQQSQPAINDFDTQLSLDDLAMQSVAPPPEPDRTPQLSDEYQVHCVC